MHVFDHLLVVAGPSCVGKSTFIDSLGGGEVPVEIADHLPPQAGTWPVLPVLYYADWPPGGAGAVVHLDTMECFFRPLIYDRALTSMQAARAITLVDLDGDPDDIAGRLLERVWRNRDLQTADPALSQAAFVAQVSMARNGSPLQLAAVSGLAAKAGIPPQAAKKLTLTRQRDWLALVRSRCHEHLARHWAGLTVDFLAVQSVSRRLAGDGGIWCLNGAAKRTF